MTEPYMIRLERARVAVAKLTAHLNAAIIPQPVADQHHAATNESGVMFHRMVAAEHALTGRYTGTTTERPAEDAAELRARVIAAMGDGHPWEFCTHLTRGTRAGVIRLALRRGDCPTCLAPLTRFPPPGDARRCDLCGIGGVARFWPLRAQLGPLLVVGDMCRICAADLGDPGALKTRSAR